MKTVPGFDSFLVASGMIQRGDGSYTDALEKLIRVQRGARYKDAPARFEFDTGIVVPITFRMQIDDLKKVKVWPWISSPTSRTSKRNWTALRKKIRKSALQSKNDP